MLDAVPRLTRMPTREQMEAALGQAREELRRIPEEKETIANLQASLKESLEDSYLFETLYQRSHRCVRHTNAPAPAASVTEKTRRWVELEYPEATVTVTS